MAIHFRFEALPISMDRHSLWRSWLTKAERERLGSYRFEDDQNRFVGRRGLCRDLIGEVYPGANSELQLDSLPSGRPIAVTQSGVLGISVSMAKSSEWIAACLSTTTSVGIDVEQERPLEELSMLASEYLSRDELQDWQRLHPDDRLGSYYRHWVIKEAALKAAGLGLTLHPGFVEVMQPYAEDDNRFGKGFGMYSETRGSLIARGELRIAMADDYVLGRYELYRFPSPSTGPSTWGAIVSLDQHAEACAARSSGMQLSKPYP